MADIATNRKAFHDYHVLEKIEAGIQLLGTEVKSCRAGDISMADAYAYVDNEQIWLENLHINPYTNGNQFNHEPRRKRRLLLHKKEILKLAVATSQKGCTLVPLSVYLKHGLIKVKLGVCQGKTRGDKRESLKKKQADRDMRQAMKRKNQR